MGAPQRPPAWLRPEQLAELCALAFLAAALFGLLAVLSFRFDFVAGGPGNWCGSVGHGLAYALILWLGYGAHVVCSLLTAWGVVLLFQRAPYPIVPKAFGLVVLAAGAAILFEHHLPLDGRVSSASAKLPAGAGGLFGYRLAPYLQEGFGPSGTYLVLALLLAIALLLATDFAFYGAGRALAERWRAYRAEAGERAKRSASASAARRAKPVPEPEPREPMLRALAGWFARARTWLGSAAPEPVVQSAGGGAAVADLPARPARRSTATPASAAPPLVVESALAEPAVEGAAGVGADLELEDEAELDQAADDGGEDDEEFGDDEEGDDDVDEEADFDEDDLEDDDEDADAEEDEAWEEDELAEAETASDDDSSDEGDEDSAADGAGESADDGESAGAAVAEIPQPRFDVEAAVSGDRGLSEMTAAEIVGDEDGSDGVPVEIRPARTSTGKRRRDQGPELPFPSPPYSLPPLRLLDDPPRVSPAASAEEIRLNSRILEQALGSFRIDAKVVGAHRGPVVTMYEVELSAGTKVARISALSDDLAIALKAPSVRVVAPIPGKSTIGIEVPNIERETVFLKALSVDEIYDERRFAIPLLLGMDVGGKKLIDDLAKMPHLLIAGATGSGKSVCINAIICSILLTRSPDEVKLILIDPKMVELQSYQRVPHLLCPVVTNMRKAPGVLEWAVQEMEERYERLSEAGVRHISDYNKLGEAGLKERLEDAFSDDTPIHLPYIVVVVDELADLMMQAAKEIETSITRLAQKSRAVGIHVILATQRPSTNVITGLIKANMPTRVAFQVASKIDSRVILDYNGAEALLGAGDMLYAPPRLSALWRAQSTYVSDAEIRRIVNHAAQSGAPRFIPELLSLKKGSEGEDLEADELYDEAVRIILKSQRGSASLLQRALGIGYTRASRLIDIMTANGVVGDFKGSKAREVLMSLDEWQAAKARAGFAAEQGEA
ncbi:MAG: DNA translocase FtsK 4TM domain-containing protein [Planctomycetes bacterium]|nr:DNA translocase FtsK 4TM domain-containing protein [Planctomycetota bacterium]